MRYTRVGQSGLIVSLSRPPTSSTQEHGDGQAEHKQG